jgi:cellulose synthase/poly-beta-1,6-N-acetylglucosamine synthase-like glycosyltransferase
MKKSLCVVVPAFNEARVIEASLDQLLRIIPQHDIYVASDGSSDETGKISRRMGVNIMTLMRNQGKARALACLIEFYNLTEKYDYILFSDADSQIAPDFFTQVQKYLIDRPACIVGTVTSDKHGLISAYRTYEYSLTHRIFKRAQDVMGTIMVAPGCASLYRSDIIQHLNFSDRTLTEDFDLTLQIHNKKLGRVVYAPHARVITQDPPDIRNYWKQITRWYTGFWQNVYIHKVFLPNKRVNLEGMLMMADGMAWVFFLLVGLMHPMAFLNVLASMYIIVIALSLGLLTLEKQWWAMWYIPLFPLFQFVNVASYTIAFFRAVKGQNTSTAWHKVDRYDSMPALA